MKPRFSGWYNFTRVKRFLNSFLLLIHYWLPIALGWSLVIVINHATGMPILPAGFHLYLFGICAIYSIDRVIDNSDPSRQVWVTWALTGGFLISITASFFLVFQLSLQAISALGLLSFVTVLYVWVKQVPFLKGFWAAIVWGWTTVALPFADTQWFALHFWTLQVSLPVVILMACAIIMCDFKDIKNDQFNGIKSFPVLLGTKRTVWAISLLLVITAIISLEENRIGLLVGSILLFILAQFPDFLSKRVVGPLAVDAALVIPGALIAFHIIS